MKKREVRVPSLGFARKLLPISKRSQSTVEFSVIFGVVLLAFVVFFGVIQSNQEEKNKEKERLLIQSIALDIQDEIGIAARATDGYQREFSVPLKFLGRDYEINVTDGLVYVATGRDGVAYGVPDLVGQIQKGPNVIRKENGVVYLNQ